MKKQPLQIYQGQQPVSSRSYILRLWCVGEPSTGNWLASLEDPSTGQRFGFSSFEQLFVFIMELSEESAVPVARDADSITEQERSSK